jgi:PPP family 3-phenylpropionic acid transporter
LLYIGLYSAYGTVSAYMPAFLRSHGLPVERIGLVLAAGTLVKIIAGPAAGRLADQLQARKQVLTLAAALSGCIGYAYMIAFGVLPLLAVSVAHSAATASLAPLSDALAVSASAYGRGFQYGWVRGAGSAAFVGGTLLSGQLVDRFGLACIILASSALFLLTALCATRVRAQGEPRQPTDVTSAGAFRFLWGIPVYRRLIFIAVLVIGSHALNDGFAVINWREAGYGSGIISLLWSESVLAEVFVFFLAGPWLIARLGPSRSAGLSAAAGIIRWTVMGSTTSITALVSVQALHGLTFALLHLAAMGIIAGHVPDRLSATAQTVYGTFALGIASALMTFASGYLYGEFGMHAFWPMALLCALALPLVAGLAAKHEVRAMNAI